MTSPQTPDDMRAAIERIVLEGILNTDIIQGKTKPLSFSFPKTNIDKLEALLKSAIAAERLRIEAALPENYDLTDVNDEIERIAKYNHNTTIDQVKRAINNTKGYEEVV